MRTPRISIRFKKGGVTRLQAGPQKFGFGEYHMREIPEIPVVPLDPATFPGFGAFGELGRQFPRKAPIADVLPKDEDYGYCLIITETDISVSGHRVVVYDFDSLFWVLDTERSVAGLGTLRSDRSIQLYEGMQQLPIEVREILLQAAGAAQLAYIRCDYSPEFFAWQVDLSTYLESEDLLCVLPNRFGFFEVTNDLQTWYLVIIDDDPFLSLSAPKDLIARLAKEASKYVLEVPGSMIYAPY